MSDLNPPANPSSRVTKKIEVSESVSTPGGARQRDALRDARLTVRRATEADREAVVGLLAREDLEAAFVASEFHVAEIAPSVEEAPRLVACARLKRFSDGTLELASVATAREYRGTGLATLLVRTLLADVEEPVYGLALAPGFFARLGFRRIPEPPPALRAKAAANCASKVFEAMVWLPASSSAEAADVRRVYGGLAAEARAAGARPRSGSEGSRGSATESGSFPTSAVACCVPRSGASLRVAPGAGLPVAEQTPAWSVRTYRSAPSGDVPPSYDLGLGTGDPVAAAALREGEIVVDLGSGPGFDVFLAARAVGPRGRAIGVDLTPEMVALARERAVEIGAANASFVEGALESVPLPDATADVVVSNCVFNLSPDKAAAFAEAFRILKPGGRFVVSDTLRLAGSHRPDGPTCGCADGALSEPAWVAHLAAAGFADVDVAVLGPFGGDTSIGRAMIRATKPETRV